MRSNGLIMFDFDGVIADTLDFSIESSRIAHGEELTMEQYRAMFYGNIFESVEVVGQRKREGKTTKPSANDLFFQHYIPQLMERPPIQAMLDVLGSASRLHPVVMISSTVDQPLRDYVKRYDLAHHFNLIMGSGVHTSKVVKINMAKELYGAADEDCLFITDTLGDIREATKAGVQSVGVTWGFHLREDLEQGNPLAIVETPAELKVQIDKFFL